MKKLKLKLEDFEVKPMSKRELLKVLGGDNVSTTDPNGTTVSPQYTMNLYLNKEVETSKEG